MTNLEHIGEYDGYQIYRNAGGFLEGYKKTGKHLLKTSTGFTNLGTDSRRIVTNAKTFQEFIDFVLGQKLKTKKTIPSPLPKLPFNES